MLGHTIPPYLAHMILASLWHNKGKLWGWLPAGVKCQPGWVANPSNLNGGVIPMRKLLAVVAVLAILSLLVGTTMAQGPVERPNTPGESQFQDQDGDGVCDVCGGSGSRQGGRWSNEAARGGMMMGGRWNGVTLVSTVADALDMSVQDVWAQVRDGKTLKQVIVDHNGDPEAIVNQYVEARKAVLDKLVEDKRITQEQADLMLDHLREQANEHLESSQPDCGMGRWNSETPKSGTFGGNRGGRGGRGSMRWGRSA